MIRKFFRSEFQRVVRKSLTDGASVTIRVADETRAIQTSKARVVPYVKQNSSSPDPILIFDLLDRRMLRSPRGVSAADEIYAAF